MRSLLTSALVAAATISLAAPAQAAFVVDTGPANSAGINYVLDPGQSLGGYFTLGSATVVSSVEGFIVSSGGSTITATIYGDGITPATPLFSTTFTSAATTGWQGAFGLNWALAAGNYWIGLDSTGSDGMFDGVANPLAAYAFTNGDTWFRFDDLNTGFRIGADAVPEPASWALMILGFGLAGGALRNRPRVRVAFSG